MVDAVLASAHLVIRLVHTIAEPFHILWLFTKDKRPEKSFMGNFFRPPVVWRANAIGANISEGGVMRQVKRYKDYKKYS